MGRHCSSFLSEAFWLVLEQCRKPSQLAVYLFRRLQQMFKYIYDLQSTARNDCSNNKK